jgi:hypothetical protein
MAHIGSFYYSRKSQRGEQQTRRTSSLSLR